VNWYYALFYLAMSTGLRCGELLGLHWDDFEGERVVTLTPDVHEVM
jgi:integrase